MTYKGMRRRAIARGVIDGVFESLTGKPFYTRRAARGPRGFRGRRTRTHPVRPARWLSDSNVGGFSPGPLRSLAVRPMRGLGPGPVAHQNVGGREEPVARWPARPFRQERVGLVSSLTLRRPCRVLRLSVAAPVEHSEKPRGAVSCPLAFR